MRIQARVASVIQQVLTHRSYIGAMGSGYLLMLASIGSQLILTPLFLAVLSRHEFGVLVIILALVNFAIIGIAWISGGSLRLLGELAANSDGQQFARAYGIIKTIYVGYGLVLGVALIAAALFLSPVLFSGMTDSEIASCQLTLLLTAPYLVIFYVVAVDRIALVARKRQASANLAQVAGVAAYAAGSVAWLLGGGGMASVMACQIAGACVSAALTRLRLGKEVSGLRFRWITTGDADILVRLGGKTGIGFFIHGALVLALLADTAILGLFAGPLVVAEYYLIWKIADVAIQMLWKLSDPLAPYIVQMDARGENDRISRIAFTGYAALAAISFVAAVIYALFGRSMVALWVGEDQAPLSEWGYVLSGCAIFWLGVARLPVVVASARMRLRQLNIVGGVELAGKWVVTLLLFPHMGYLALLVGINVIHFAGVALLYFRLLLGHSRPARPGPTRRSSLVR